MWEQIRANRRRSILLVFLMAGMLMGVGYGLGATRFPGGGPVGLGIAFVVWLVMSLVSYYQGGNILLALSGAREIQRDDLRELHRDRWIEQRVGAEDSGGCGRRALVRQWLGDFSV